jgi:hypothetical protein
MKSIIPPKQQPIDAATDDYTEFRNERILARTQANSFRPQFVVARRAPSALRRVARFYPEFPTYKCDH